MLTQKVALPRGWGELSFPLFELIVSPALKVVVCAWGRGGAQTSIEKLHWCHDGGGISMTAKVTLKVLQSMDLVPVRRRMGRLEGAGSAVPAELLRSFGGF